VSELDERRRFVEAAMSWIGTPYHHCANIKGVGCDCATFLVGAAQEAGLLAGDFKLPDYSPHWHLHRSAQKYLATIATVCSEVPMPPQSGDIVLFEFGRTFSHGAIVVEWPTVVHSCIGHMVRTDDVSKAAWLQTIGEIGPKRGQPRPMKLLSLWSR
jgi:cell wall-associated NlpC family hydrolase